MILDRCVGCGTCATECPTEAIYECDDIYTIDPDRCTECLGFYDEPQCVILCPARAIVPDLEHKESREDLLRKGEKLLISSRLYGL